MRNIIVLAGLWIRFIEMRNIIWIGNNKGKLIFAGDGNIHLNISVKEFTQDILKRIEPFVYEHTSQLRGSVSAEHGVGFRKPKYMHYSKTESAINLMKDIKRIMDPNGILNPYKVLPS